MGLWECRWAYVSLPEAVWIRSRARLSHSMGAWPVSEESGSQIDKNAMGD